MTTEESREVAEARAAVIEVIEDLFTSIPIPGGYRGQQVPVMPALYSERVNALVEAVRKDERERFPRKQLEAARSHLLMPPHTWPADQALDYINIALHIMAAPAEGGTEG